MPKIRSNSSKAEGKLISAIQREWGEEIGDTTAAVSEEVMYSAHSLLQAENAEQMKAVLSGRSIEEYLGEIWVKRHPSVKHAVIKSKQQLRQNAPNK